jgi:predicted nucleic acid-binding protein
VGHALESLGLTFQEMPKPALFLASRAFVKYRRDGGTKGNVLADFFIAAHAAVLNCSILTRDGRRYRNHFPRVHLIVPDGRHPG